MRLKAKFYNRNTHTNKPIFTVRIICVARITINILIDFHVLNRVPTGHGISGIS